LPNVGPYIYDVSISGFTRSSIYIYDISSLRVKSLSPSLGTFVGTKTRTAINLTPVWRKQLNNAE